MLRPLYRYPCAALALALLLDGAGCGQAPGRAGPKPPGKTHVSSATGEQPTEVPVAPAGDVAVQEPTQEAPEWVSLFDGETLGNWRSTNFGGEGEVSVEGGAIMLPMGDDMTGITWRGEPPARTDYEIELEAQRVEGNDFFCGLTFPVDKDSCSLICGGWGGGVTGLSSLDGNDASRNETSQWINYEKGRWYRIRVRVTEHAIAAWLDDKPIVDTDIKDRKVGIRGEVEPSKPLGIATWRTTGAIRALRLRKLAESKPGESQI